MLDLKDRPAVKLLVVDDEQSIRGLLLRWLRDEGYDCLEAANGDEAWAQLQAHEVALATFDISMPGETGLQLLDRVHAAFPDTEVVMLTAEGCTDKAIQALTGGACGYLIKPIEREELLFHVRRGLQHRQLTIDARNYTLQLEDRVRQQTEEIRQAYEETIHRLVSASEYRDEETGAHIKRTGLLSEVLALAAGWDPVQAERLRMAAPMHDVGKIGIPDAILHKQGRLDPDEIEIMKQHTTIGAEMLAGSKSQVLQLAHTIALSHHERWDGSGYPAGLAGTDIPLAARIVGIVDVYDAVTHDRVYRPAFSEAEALSIMLDGSGTHFDPDLLELFLSRLPEMRRICELNCDVLPNDDALAQVCQVFGVERQTAASRQ